MAPEHFAGLRRTCDTLFGKVAYVEQGEGPAALFIHGLPLNGFHWRHALERLSDRRRCIAPDLLGLGWTEARDGQSLDFDAQAGMLLALMDTLGARRFDLVGSDSGAGIAQIIAAHAPGRIRSLTLTNGDVHDNYPPPAVGPLHALAKAGRLGQTFAGMLDDPAAGRALMASAFQYPERLTSGTLQVYLSPLVGRPDRQAQIDAYVLALDPARTVRIYDHLKAVTAPALVVWGNDDVFFPIQWAHWLCETLPGARPVEVLEGARLFFAEERPGEFIPLLARHWDEAMAEAA